MKKVSLALVAILTIFTACKENPKSQFNRKVADYAVVTLETPSLEGISDNGKEVLNLYRFAAQEIDALYWEQYFGNRDSLLSAIKDPVQQLFAQINYGPWDRTDGKSFVEGYADRLPGAGFYPSDMTVQEFENFEDPAKASPYTLITRGEDGSLKAVWYHDAYKEHEIPKISDGDTIRIITETQRNTSSIGIITLLEQTVVIYVPNLIHGNKHLFVAMKNDTLVVEGRISTRIVDDTKLLERNLRGRCKMIRDAYTQMNSITLGCKMSNKCAH